MKDNVVPEMKVFVRHQDITKEIIELCKVSQPKQNCRGVHVPIPADPLLTKRQGFFGGYAMITGYN